MSVVAEAVVESDVPLDAAFEIPPARSPYRQYALIVLMAVFMVNFIDRQVINILAEPIKKDLHLHDWQIGLMSGFAFALCYSTFGMPIARVAERHNRPLIIATAITVWSGFTVLCGFAQNFTQLILLRVGFGIGEAGCTPPAHSLIMDDSPPEKRASAISIYHMGVPLGSLVGLAMGGIIADLQGWRWAFILCGAPGVLVALLVATTLREPRRAFKAQMEAARALQPSFAETVRYLAGKRSFWFMSLGAALKGLVAYGAAPFTASFFFRAHTHDVAVLAAHFGLKSGGFLGLALGLIGGVTGMFGTWLGGVLADRAARRDLRAFADIPAIAAVLTVPASVGVLLTPSVPAALGLMVISGVLASIWSGPVHAGILGVAPRNMRATTSSILLFILNGIGLGLGPLCVGITSDLLAGPLGLGPAEGVRWALIIMYLFGLANAAVFWTARRTLREDIL